MPQLQGLRGRSRAARWPSWSPRARWCCTTTRWRSSTPAPTSNFSTRALNAAAVVLDTAGPGAFQKFHDLVYAHQTPEDGAGLTDAQLVSYAGQAGATGDAGRPRRSTDEKFADWTKKVTDQASKDGVTGTPTVIVGGKKLADLSPAGMTAAVTAAAAKVTQTGPMSATLTRARTRLFPSSLLAAAGLVVGFRGRAGHRQPRRSAAWCWSPAGSGRACCGCVAAAGADGGAGRALYLGAFVLAHVLALGVGLNRRGWRWRLVTIAAAGVTYGVADRSRATA